MPRFIKDKALCHARALVRVLSEHLVFTHQVFRTNPSSFQWMATLSMRKQNPTPFQQGSPEAHALKNITRKLCSPLCLKQDPVRSC